MRYGFLFFALSLWLPTALAGQSTLHVLYLNIAYEEDEIHQGCRLDSLNATSLFTTVGELATEAGNPLNVRVHQLAYDRTGVLNYLRDLQPAPEDAVVFMFSGHGVEDPAETGWPLLYLCSSPDTALHLSTCGLSLQAIHDQLRTKNVRMSLTIGSSCNHDPLADTTAQRMVRSPLTDLTTSPGGTTYDFELFTDYRGHILASASEAGQPAYLTDDLGSYYVYALLEMIVEGIVSDEGSSWARILRSTDERVRTVYRVDQNAQFTIHRDNQLRSNRNDNPTVGSDTLDEALSLLPYYLIGDIMMSVDEEDEELYRAEVAEARAFFDRQAMRGHHLDYSEELSSIYFDSAAEEEDFDFFIGAYSTFLDYLPQLPTALRTQIESFTTSPGSR
jgi:hypothetical protein